MRALSLTPPWPSAILHLNKRIENRVRWKGCAYRGPILLHAAKGIGTYDEFDETVENILSIVDARSDQEIDRVAGLLGVRADNENWWRPGHTMLRAGIVGRAEIVDVIHGAGDVARIERRMPGQARWWMGGFALVLDKVESLPFVPWPGSLGLFEVPDHVWRAA